MNLNLLLASAFETKWAMLPGTLDAVISILERNSHAEFSDFHKASRDAYVGDIGKAVQGTTFTSIVGNTGIITIDGPLIPRSGMLSADSTELASYERLSKEFLYLENNPEISNILLVLDTPGGSVSGVSEFASLIKNSTKNTQAFVIGMAASAGYWICSAVDRIFSSNTGEVGSIGVVAAIRDTRERDKKDGVQTIEIVSSVSPFKRVDPLTDAGRAEIKRVIDDLGEIFVSTVAANRNVDRATVIEKFGAGGMLVASSALNVGMIDEITTLKDLISKNNSTSATVSNSLNMSEGIMPQNSNASSSAADNNKILSAAEFKQNNPTAYDEILKKGAELERARIQGIESISHPEAAALVKEHKFNGSSTKETVALLFAEQLSKKSEELSSSNAKVADAARKLSTTLQEIPSGASTSSTTEDVTTAAIAKAIADGGNQSNGRS